VSAHEAVILAALSDLAHEAPHFLCIPPGDSQESASGTRHQPDTPASLARPTGLE
jgi:hypothetical protein